MNTEIKLPPQKLIASIGGSFELFGTIRTKLFTDNFGLKPTDNVLDVGCGCGRMATYLTEYLIGNYEGFDIMGDCIDWCQKEITPKYPNFKFKKIDVFNKHYNPKSSVKASEFRFPCEDNVFDFVFLTSVFTHMLPEDILNYLKEIIRVLKQNGKCIITYFLINEESLALISENKTHFKFKPYSENIYVMNDKDPEAAIGFKEKYVEEMYYNNDFEIKEIRYGNWCGRESKLLGQDLVYSIKCQRRISAFETQTQQLQETITHRGQMITRLRDEVSHKEKLFREIIARKDCEIHRYREELFSVYTSRSWRCMLPFRKVGSLIRQIMVLPHQSRIRVIIKRAYFILPAFIRNSKSIEKLKNRFKNKEMMV